MKNENIKDTVLFVNKLSDDNLAYLKLQVARILEECDLVLKFFEALGREMYRYSRISLDDIKKIRYYYDSIKTKKVHTDKTEISFDDINEMDYKELSDFIKFVGNLRYISNDSELMTNEFSYAKRIQSYRESLVLKGVIDLEEMELEDYYILLNNVGSNKIENYAISCGVDPDELTAEDMYRKYHVRSIGRCRK